MRPIECPDLMRPNCIAEGTSVRALIVKPARVGGWSHLPQFGKLLAYWHGLSSPDPANRLHDLRRQAKANILRHHLYFFDAGKPV